MNINITLIGQAGTFLVFILFTMYFVWPPLKQALQQRKEEIAEGLAAAERGQQEEASAQERAEETLREAREQAAGIIDQAQKRGNELIEEAKETARAEGDRLKQAAKAEIEQETNRAREELRGQVVAIAMAGAERVLGEEVDAKSHGKMLDKLASEL